MARWLSSRVGFGLVAALYLLAFPYHPGLQSANELVRLWTSRALVDHGTFVLNQTMAEFGPVRDMSCAAVFVVGGARVRAPCLQPPPGGVMVERNYLSSKAPLASLLGAPIYAALKLFGTPVTELGQVYFSRLFVQVLPSLWLLYLLRRFLRAQLPEDTADVLVVAYAVGTFAFSYAQAFMSHQLSAVLLFAAFFAAWRTLEGAWRWWGWLAAGAAAGAAVMAEYTAALTVLCLAGYVVAARWKRWREVGVAAGLVLVGSAPFLGGLMAFHTWAYGHPLESGYRWLNDANYQGWHMGGFLGIRSPDLTALLLSCFSPLRGFFTLSPFLLFLFPGLQPLKAKAWPLWVLTVSLLLGSAYFTSGFEYHSWGWTVGPRHLTPLLPFLALPVGLALERFRAAPGPWRSVLGGLVVSSTLTVGVVCFVNYIPDDVSTSLFGVAVPVLTDGFWPVTWLPAVGLANPVSGALFVALLLGVAAWLGGRFVTGVKVVPALAVVALVAHLGLLRLATKGDGADQGAVRLLESVWLAPRGQTFQFFGR